MRNIYVVDGDILYGDLLVPVVVAYLILGGTTVDYLLDGLAGLSGGREVGWILVLGLGLGGGVERLG